MGLCIASLYLIKAAGTCIVIVAILDIEIAALMSHNNYVHVAT